MFENIIRFSVKHKFIVFLLVGSIVGFGIYSMGQIPLDAVPDITNNQVQIVTVSPSLAPQEIEQLITFPVEMAVRNIPDLIEIRSISRYGLSVVTAVFKDRIPILDARQYVREQLNIAEGEIPDELGVPELMPITTGLGEIFQYTLDVDSAYREYYGPMELRTIQDWIVKRQLSGVPGIIEVSSFGGYLKQYEVAVNPAQLRQFKLSIHDVYDALSRNNQNSGGSYIEKKTNAYYIRTEGRVTSLEDIENIVISGNQRSPIYIGNVGKVSWGSPKRYGAMTKDGLGEAVGGITLMFKGANSSEAIRNVKARIEQVQKSLPPGVTINSYLDRSELIGRTIKTASNNLIEGGLVVIFILILLLGHWRAGLVVASIIPLSMLFAFIMMHLTGVSANLMSLGAIDFGIVVDGAVIIVENILFTLYSTKLGMKLSQSEMDTAITESSTRIYKSAAFGVLIILVVFLPIVTLSGIEGKTFRPMALTVSYAILGAMILSMTYVPVVSSLLLSKKISTKKTFSDRIMGSIRNTYLPILKKSLQLPIAVITVALALFLSTIVLFSRMGAEFIPTLEEGDLAMQMTIQPGSSLTESINTSTKAEQILISEFPEVKHVVSKIGTAEVPTDPMAIEDADIMIVMEEKEAWVSAESREEMVEKMKKKLELIVGASFEFTQPIQLRFNELMTGAKTDIAVKVFGEDTNELVRLGNKVATIIEGIRGAGDVKVEQTDGLSQLVVKVDRHMLARYGIDAADVNQAIRAAYAGEVAGVVFEGEKKFDLVIRLQPDYREELDLSMIHINAPNGNMIPLNQLASTELIEGPMQISREDAKRRIVVGVNVRNRDVASLVEEIEQKLSTGCELPPGYFITYGGQFENLKAAEKRLSVAVPIALFLIFIFLFSAFKSLKYSALIFTAVPLAAIGGVCALYIRNMPFSISAGIGFIALFGVAVLNGIVLISYLNELKEKGDMDIKELIVKGSLARLRPVLMTAGVAAFGFLPMALSTSAGAEVQKPLATVVIGGLISSTLLTLLVLPVIYLLVNQKYKVSESFRKGLPVILFFLGIPLYGQNELSMDEAVSHAKTKNADLLITKKSLEQSRLTILQSFDPDNLEFEYQQGKINADLVDHYWQVNQSFGNPVKTVTDRRVRVTNYETEKASLRILEKELSYRTKVAWINWSGSYRKSQIAENILPLMEQLEEAIATALELGEIDFLTHQHFTELSRSLENMNLQIRLEHQKNWTLLQNICQLDSTYSPANYPLIPAKSDSVTLDPLFETVNAQKALIEKMNIKSKTAEYYPTLSAGYFNQQIEGLKGLDGWKVGIGIPLWMKPKSADVQQARIEAEKVELLNNYTIVNYGRRLDNLSNFLDQLSSHSFDDISLFDNDLNKIKQALDAGNVNYFQFVQTLSDLLENYIQSIELRSIYYQTIYEIEFLTR